MKKNELVNCIKKLLKKECYVILKNNKFLVEYPECYVVLWLSFYNGCAELNYNICFKKIHGLLDVKQDFNKWLNCDFNEFPKLNHYGDVENRFNYSLLDLDENKLKEDLIEMLRLYIEPFNDSLDKIIEFINKGRLYKHPYKKEYVEPYYFLPKAKKFLLENGMRPIEEFFE